MVVAQRAVARQQVARRVVLALQRLGRRHAGQPAELVFAQNLDLRAVLRVQLLGLLQLHAAGFVAGVASVAGGKPEPLRSDDQHRRLRVDVVGGRAAEARDERARVLAAERAQLAGKHDDLSCEGVMS